MLLWPRERNQKFSPPNRNDAFKFEYTWIIVIEFTALAHTLLRLIDGHASSRLSDSSASRLASASPSKLDRDVLAALHDVEIEPLSIPASSGGGTWSRPILLHNHRGSAASRRSQMCWSWGNIYYQCYS